MALDKHLSTPVAILIAGVLVAAGLFFGLRGRDAGPPASPGADSTERPQRAAGAGPTPAPDQTAGGAVAAQPSRPPTPAATAVTADRNAATTAALKDLERHRAAIVDKCVKPSLAKTPEPPTVKLVFNVTFNEQGQQIARGISEDRATSRYEVTQCVTDALPPLQVPAQGASVMVDLPWTLP